MIPTVYEIINHENLKKHIPLLENEYIDYIPLEILTLLRNPVPYYKRRTDTAKIKFQEKRNNIPSENVDQYLIDDILEWINENNQFKDIINWEVLKQ